MRYDKLKKILIASVVSGLLLADAVTAGSFPRALADEIPVEVPTGDPVVTPTPDPAVTDAISSISVISSPQTIVCGETPTPEQFSINIYHMNGITETGVAESVSVDATTTGIKSVTVTYGGVSAIANIQVIPRTPTNLHMSDGTSTSIRLNWDALTEAKSYEVEMKNADGTFSLVGTTAVNAYDFTGLNRGELKYIRVRAISQDTDINTGAVTVGQGGYSQEYAIAPRPDDMNGAVTASKLNRLSMVFIWDPVGGATGYTVYLRKPDESEYSNATAESVATNNGKIKYKVTGLKGGYDYYVKVVPFAGDLTNSSGGSAEALYGTAPTLPTITARGGDGVIRVNYGGGRSAANYKLYMAQILHIGDLEV